jgi:hypothetical protein
LDIRIAFKTGHAGVFHDKLGIFRDSDGHAVSFVGSVNETAAAWDLFGNHEFFEVFCSWTPDDERVAAHQIYFERLWKCQEPGVETTPFPDAAKARLTRLADPNGPEAAFERIVQQKAPSLGRVPQPHQLRAVSSWRAHHQGILAHATGSGKTFTAVLAIKDWIREEAQPS